MSLYPRYVNASDQFCTPATSTRTFYLPNQISTGRFAPHKIRSNLCFFKFVVVQPERTLFIRSFNTVSTSLWTNSQFGSSIERGGRSLWFLPYLATRVLGSAPSLRQRYRPLLHPRDVHSKPPSSLAPRIDLSVQSAQDPGQRLRAIVRPHVASENTSGDATMAASDTSLPTPKQFTMVRTL